MQSGSRFALTVGVLAVLVAGLLPGAPAATAAVSPSQADALRAQRAQLVAQLNALKDDRADARGRLLTAEDMVTSVEQQLAATRQDLEATNATLQRLAQEISDHERSVSEARSRLGGLLRATYEATDRDGFATVILASDDFSSAIDRIRGAQHLTDELHDLRDRVDADERALVAERSDLQVRFAQAQQDEQQLTDEEGRMLAVVAQRDLAFNDLSGQARVLAAQIAEIDRQLAPPAPRRTSSGTCGNHFAYGNCTYYVATRRCIPWLGNAWEWWGAAAGYGYPEGHTPQRGAVVVWGRTWSSPYGHVAYVEAVGPAAGVPAGSFLISEMNYSGWNRVDYRIVADNAPGILGFIYG